MPTYGYNPTIPASGNNPANDQPLMQTNFASIEGIISSDHYTFGSAGSNDGFHQKLTIPLVQGADPNLVAPIASLYTKAVAGLTQLFFQNGALATDVVQLTGGLTSGLNGAGFTEYTIVTPFGLTLKFGLGKANFAGFTNTFASNFSTGPLGIVVSARTPANSTFAGMSGAPARVAGTDQFVGFLTSAGPGTQEMYYVAWGN